MIGYKEILILIVTSGLLISNIVLFTLLGLDELHMDYNGEHMFTTIQWTVLIFFTLLPVMFIGAVIGIFGKRDFEVGMREVKLPVSIYDEWKDDTSRQTLIDNIIEVYPRWTFTITGHEGKIIKKPIYGSAEKGGFGFKLKDGRRFGYEPTSRMITENDLRKALGDEKFERSLLDHAKFTQEEWRSLKKAISHWYSGPEGYLVIGVSIGLLVMFLQGAVLSIFRTQINIAVPFIIVSMLLYMGPFTIIAMSGSSKWFFIRGTIYRIKDIGEELPDWLEIKSEQLKIKK
jgi:hypothetical protein